MDIIKRNPNVVDDDFNIATKLMYVNPDSNARATNGGATPRSLDNLGQEKVSNRWGDGSLNSHKRSVKVLHSVKFYG